MTDSWAVCVFLLHNGGGDIFPWPAQIWRKSSDHPKQHRSFRINQKHRTDPGAYYKTIMDALAPQHNNLVWPNTLTPSRVVVANLGKPLAHTEMEPPVCVISSFLRKTITSYLMPGLALQQIRSAWNPSKHTEPNSGKLATRSRWELNNANLTNSLLLILAEIQHPRKCISPHFLNHFSLLLRPTRLSGSWCRQLSRITALLLFLNFVLFSLNGDEQTEVVSVCVRVCMC